MTNEDRNFIAVDKRCRTIVLAASLSLICFSSVIQAIKFNNQNLIVEKVSTQKYSEILSEEKTAVKNRFAKRRKKNVENCKVRKMVVGYENRTRLPDTLFSSSRYNFAACLPWNTDDGVCSRW